MALDYSSPERYLASGGTLTNGQIPSQQITSSGEMKPISVAGMNEPATPVSVPPQPIPSNYNAITGSTAASFSDILAGLNKQTETKTSELKTSEDRQLSLLQKLGLKPQAQGTEEDIQAQKLGYENLAQAQTRLTGINRQLQALSLESKAAQLAVEGQGRGITQGQIQLQQKDIERQNSIKALGLSAQGLIIQGDIEGAQNAASRAIDLQFEQPEAELKFLQTTYEFSKNELDRVDKKRSEALGIALQERTRLLAEEKTDKTTITAMALAAMKNFPNDQQAQYAAQQALKSNNLQESFGLVGKYQTDPLATQKALAELDQTKAQIAYTKAQTAKVNKEVSELGLPPITNKNAEQYADALDVILGSGKFTKDQKTSVIRAVNSGQDPFTVIKNQAKNLLGQTGDTKLTGYEVARTQLTDVEKLLTTFYANGGQTSFLSGNYEKVINKLGEVKDPKLVEIATQIASALQIYRNAVSGTAYSVQEGVDIAAIFPGINKTQGLNKAILKGRAAAFDSTIDGMYRSVLGDTYDKLKIANAPASLVVMIGPDGVEYNVPNAQVEAFIKAGGKRK